MRSSALLPMVVSALILSASAFPADVDPGEFGVLYNCGFPVTVKLDGSFGEWPGNVPWHKVKHSMGWNTPKNDEDGSFEFACAADENFLYIAIKIRDDDKCVDENVGDDVWNDDSIELYIDGDNSKSAEYEADVSQITIGRYNIGEDPKTPKLNAWTGGNGLGQAASATGTMAAVVDTDYGWAMEVAVPLDSFNIELDDGTVIGFNVQLNDDDDGGDVDHKLSWSEKEREGDETAYLDPSVFGELKFLRDFLAVSAEGKLATTWASIKR
jgi:hypothetical protein